MDTQVPAVRPVTNPPPAATARAITGERGNHAQAPTTTTEAAVLRVMTTATVAVLELKPSGRPRRSEWVGRTAGSRDHHHAALPAVKAAGTRACPVDHVRSQRTVAARSRVPR